MKTKKTQDEKFEAVQNSRWAQVCETLYGIIMLNVMLILFSFCGLLVFGVGPATMAGYHWLIDNEGLYVDSSMIKDFWKLFKKYFWKGNIIFYSLLIISFVFIQNVIYYATSSSQLASVGLLIVAILGMLFIGISENILWVSIKFNKLSVIDKIRTSFYLVFKKPFLFLKLTLILIGFLFIMFLFPQFSIFFGFATPIYIIYKELTNGIDIEIINYQENQEEE